MMNGFIFGGNTGLTAEQIRKRREIALAMMKGSGSAPRNVGEGIYSAASSIAGALMDKRLGREEARLMGERHGAQPGLGGDGLNAGSAMYSPQPNLLSGGGATALSGDQGGDMLEHPQQGYGAEQRVRPNYTPPQGEVPPDGYNPYEMIGEHGDPRLEGGSAGDYLANRVPNGESFQPGAEYQTADMSGIEPSGVGERSQLNATARAFQGFMKSLEDYEQIFNDGGATMLPGPRRDTLSTAHRDLQMQMKELYNLGVLNGPDLDLMNEILISPTSVSGNLMDAVGISDMETRIPENIREVRRMMINRSEPALQQLGIDPDSLMPQRGGGVGEMSDEQLMQMLMGG